MAWWDDEVARDGDDPYYEAQRETRVPDPWTEAARELDQTPVRAHRTGPAIAPGFRVVDGRVLYSAAWLDEVAT